MPFWSFSETNEVDDRVETVEITEIQKGSADEDSSPTESREVKSWTWITHPDEISASIRVNEKGDLYSNAVIDVFNYDMKEEAEEETVFSWFGLLDDTFVRFLDPISYIYVYLQHGYFELQARLMVPPPADKVYDGCINTLFHDPDEPPFVIPTALMYFVINLLNGIRWVMILSFYFGQLYSLKDQGKSRAPLYLFGVSFLFYWLVLLSMANKKALRKVSESKRLVLCKERRNEELIYGWLPLPWNLAVFELRLAAAKLGVDVSSGHFTFKECNEEELRMALGVCFPE